ncbi:MAG TPA: glycosyltransferase family 2 protein [Tepidisphaeraceae bacterium]|jgi:glycosyltransferase involved in cell wall biosynthesis|nr:glycosyltransferase family 2 protein [Tepidisphaeraceae bacterium]
MLHNQKVIVVLPAYRAAKTVERTFHDLPLDVVDEVLLVDDAGGDETAEIARRLGIRTISHRQNLGYGANQKTCYFEALAAGADIVVMVHPDYQYDPRLVTAMAGMVASGIYDAVLGSRIGTARKGGMPLWKYVANRALSAVENLLLGTKLTEFHTGYRAFSKKVLQELPLLADSDDFVFDNQMIAQLAAFGFTIGEISCPTKYFSEASSINFRRSVTYGIGVLRTSVQFRLWKWGMSRPKIFVNNSALRLGSAEGQSRQMATVVGT